MESKIEHISVFFAGGIVYSLLEILWRGFTHWTMTVAGGVCFLLLYGINRIMAKRPLLLRCLAGAGVITAVEFAAGVVVNLVFRLDVWDYSDLPFNLLGQICPFFSMLWFLICIPAFFLGSLIRQYFKLIFEQ